MKMISLFLSLAVLSATASAANIDDISPDILAAYIEGAAGESNLSAMTAVGAVIVNRCTSERYPDSVISNGAALGITPSPVPSDMAKCAADLAVSGFDPTSGAVVFFRNTDVARKSRHEKYVSYSTSGLYFATR